MEDRTTSGRDRSVGWQIPGSWCCRCVQLRGEDAGELAELAGWLRDELLDLDVQGVDRLPGEAVPSGAKGLADVAGWLLVQLGPEALRVVLAKVARLGDQERPAGGGQLRGTPH